MQKKLTITESGYKQMAADKIREQEALEWSDALIGDGTLPVKITQVDSPKSIRRLGFMIGEGKIPDDFDSMEKAEIEKPFSAES